MMWRTVYALGFFVGLSWQQKDPLADFCRRWGHQTAVIDRRLYIDGGQVNWNPIPQNPNNYTNTWLLYQDLDTSPTGLDVPQIYANLSKNASIPDVTGGVLWADDVNKRFYMYGGEYIGISPNSPNLISYDAIYNEWDSFGPPDQPIQGVSYGGGVSISERGEGYMYGGWLSNASVPNWSGAPLASSSLIKYNMDSRDWTNFTGPDALPRAEGVMTYLPASDSGILVYFGGITTPYNNETIEPSPMSTIYIYEIKSGTWYTQNATGDIPGDRRRFCAGAAWVLDQSSYNIFLYGGLGFGANYSGYDDIYILSLPSFKWIKYWASEPGTGVPHHSLSCNVVDGKMLVIGGTFPLTENCDAPIVWGTHNVDLGKQSGYQWHAYQLNTTSYVNPPEVIAVIGGSKLGGATLRTPIGGFDHPDLSVYFSQQANIAARTPTRAIPTATSTPAPSEARKLSTGAIAGIAVGGAVLLAALLVGAYCCLRRHRTNRQPPPTQMTYNPTDLDDFQVSVQSPYSPQQESYQLPAEPPPAELSATHGHEQDPKYMYHVSERHYDAWQPVSPNRVSPGGISPRPSVLSGTDISTSTTHSPAPTYSTLGGRQSRVKPPPNQTYYSP